jgi:PhnB protein
MSGQRDDEAVIRGMIEDWSRAIEAKDAERIVEAYTDETELFDAIPPYRTVGKEQIAVLWRQCLPYFPAEFRSEHRNLKVDISGDLAVARGMHHFVPDQPEHECGATWMRVTVVLQRIGGRWRVIHEHVSVPFDPTTNKAAFITDPDNAPAVDWSAEAKQSESADQTRAMPHLVCDGAAKAIEFYKAAFGAAEMMRLPDPSGKLMHASIDINGSTIMLCDEYPNMGNASPKRLNGTPVTIHLPVADVDAFTERAIAAGATVIMPVADMFWGDRYGVIEDPFGHRWSIATPNKAMSADDIQAALKQMAH